LELVADGFEHRTELAVTEAHDDRAASVLAP
jgi:hypothetical protein